MWFYLPVIDFAVCQACSIFDNLHLSKVNQTTRGLFNPVKILTIYWIVEYSVGINNRSKC